MHPRLMHAGRAVVSAAILCVVTGCARSHASASIDAEAFEVPAPAPSDRGDFCADVGDVRACWGVAEALPDCAGGVCLVARPLPPGPALAGGWRCHGQSSERRCVRRGHAVGAFLCSGTACTQNYPRAPDDGAWACADMDGVVICNGGEPAAGVVPGPPDSAFVCGARRTGGARICVDLAPDLPDEAALGQRESWSCTFDYAGGGSRRVCEKTHGTRIGRACEAPPNGCPRGARCVGGRCVPERIPKPECWLDRDCDVGHTCQLAACVRRGS